jgi:hypothetical protein
VTKETKFNYGLLFVGLALPIIADYFLGRACGVIVAILVLMVGGILLASGHTHPEQGMSVSRRKRLAAYAFMGALASLAIMAIRVVYAREFARPYSAQAPTADVKQPPPSAPKGSSPQATPPAGNNESQQRKRAGRAIASQDNSVHMDHGSKIEQQSNGDCSPNMVGGGTVNCAPPERHLSEQQKTILSGLAIPEGMAVTLSLSGQDKDSQLYGHEIYSACNGKIPLTDFFPMSLFSGSPPQGIIVRIHDNDQLALVQLAAQIAQTLNTPTTPVAAAVTGNAKPNIVEIIIGPATKLP